MKIQVNPLFRRVPWSRMRTAFSEILPYVQPVRRDLIVAMLCSVGAVVMVTARPWPIKIVFDYALLPDKRVKWVFPYAVLKGYGAMGVVTICCILLLAISLLWGTFTYMQRFSVSMAGQQVTFALRRRMFAHLQRLSLAFHRQQHVGDLVMRSTSDINMMRDMMVDAVVILFSDGIVILTMLVVMSYMDWQLTMISLAVLPLLAIAIFRITSDLRDAVRKKRQREGRVASKIGEMLQAIVVIQAFGREGYEDSRFGGSNRRDLRQGKRTVRLEAKLERTSELVIALGTGTVLWFGVRRVLQGILTPGDLIVFTSYLAGMYKPLRRMAKVSGRLSKATVCAERVFAVLRNDHKIKVRRDALPAPALEGRLTFRNVTFSYRHGQPVLREINLRVEAGQSVALVGPNGAGKSTICGLIPRLFEPDEGVIKVDGQKIGHFQLESLRERIGMVLQQPMLFSASIAENIAYGKPDATQAEIEEAAMLADAHEFIVALADGYDTHVGERGETLSGGQRQKLAIARAMIKNPSILILDEPTAALDDSSARQLNDTLARVARGKTTVRVGHRLAELSSSDVIIVIEGGRITQRGSHEQLMQIPGWYREVFLLQTTESWQELAESDPAAVLTPRRVFVGDD